ncbi:hypothetical protein [Streptomyces sp. MZ04]|uniref:hypothetical protein n=1 Tax=Streptomyces sp. MZ04 TaxID=2559236 RepID=UPI00107EE539|nr:hypothetical protein [Streptomyces sp. MZ04]TGB11577.1 hypothetical protein E2651_12925 [Streptomyces sp. MZ04]
MTTRNAIVELLNAGYSDKAIERELHIPRTRARDLRAELDLPQHKPGRTPAASPEAIFWQRAIPTDDGHLLWPTYKAGETRSVRHGGRKYSVHRLAFSLAHTREPVGKVRTGCEREGCVHPRCVEDQQMREQYRAIFGEAA